MKKILLRFSLIIIVFAAFTLPSCEFLDECGTCVQYTVDEDGNIVNQSAALPFCGDDLTERQNSSSTTIGGLTSYWECN